MLRRLALIVAVLVLGVGSAAAQLPGGGVGQHGSVIPGDCAEWFANGQIEDAGAACGSGGGGTPGGTSGQVQYNNAGAFGGLTPAISTGCNATGGTIGASLVGTISTQIADLPIAGATYTVGTSSECGGATDLNNATTATAVTVPAAGSGIFTAGWFETYHVPSTAVTATFTPASGTINGGASLALAPGTSGLLRTDGTNYFMEYLGAASFVTASSTTTFTNKTLTSSTNSLGGVTAAFGSDAKGDIYTNGGSSNILTRLGIGSTGNCLVVASGLPSWGSCGSGLTVGTTAITSGTTTNIEYNNAGVLGEYTISGTGTVVAMAASPTFTGTPAAPTPGSNVNTTQIPTSAWVNTYYAPLASPAITGSGTAVGWVMSGAAGFTSTTTLVPAAGTLGFAGTSSAPTFAANSEGECWLSATNGLSCAGQGSSWDWTWFNKSGTALLSAATGAQLTLRGSLNANTNGINTIGSLIGGTAAASPTAFAISSGSTSTAGSAAANITITGGNATGTGAGANGASLVFTAGTSTNGTAGTIALNSTTSVSCASGLQTSSGGVLSCVVSAMRFKKPVGKITIKEALDFEANADPSIFEYNNKEQYGVGEKSGLYADEVCQLSERLCQRDADGKVLSYDERGVLAIVIRAQQATFLDRVAWQFGMLSR